MENLRNSSHSSKENNAVRSLLSQTQNNTTLWIGHLQTDPNDHIGGQTFICPSEGLLNNIQVYSSAVPHPGELTLSLHEFDRQSKTWGPAIAHSSKVLHQKDVACWIRFDLEAVSLKRETCYGFRLQSANALVGLGEAVSHAKKPFPFGLSWNADTRNTKGRYFNYFSLAFKVELCA